MNITQKIVRLNLLPLWKRRIRVWNFDFIAPSLDRLTALYLHRARLMGEEEKLFFESRLRPGMTVVDIGANQGLYTLLFSRLVGTGGRVISFEPEADMYRALIENARHNGVTNVECHKIALGSKSGTATLSRSLIHGGDNRMASGHGESTSRKESVPVSTLDEIAGSRLINLIKMDVQGWEGEVFQGMKGVLERNRDILIYFEFWPRGLRMAGCDPEGLLQSFSRFGFQLFEQVKGAQHRVDDFPELIERLSGNRFTDLLAKR